MLPGEELRRLSQISPSKSAAHIALEWGLIVCAGCLGSTLFDPWLYPIVVCFIAARQHALITLMHEGAHHRLFSHRALNDWMAELFLAWPFFFFSMKAYRKNHLPHHRYTNEAGDPDWERKQNAAWRFPMSWRSLGRLLLLDLSGLGLINFLVAASKLPRDLRRVGFLLLVVGMLSMFDLWRPFLLFWVVPFLTWLQLILHVRSIAEHFALPDREGHFGKTRTTEPTLFDRIFVGPKSSGYHLEHHLYPSVPFYNLPRLHAVLMQDAHYRASAHITRGYLAVLRECTIPRSSCQT